jgi:small-conductance mechanosensitive channel
MTLRRRYSGNVKGACAAALLAIFSLGAAPADSVRPQDITSHLQRVVAWYRDVNSAELPPQDVLIRDNVQQTSLQALKLAFQFARAESALIRGTAAAPASSTSGNLQQYAAKAADRVTAVQMRINDLDAQIPKAPARQRQELQASRKALMAELGLAKEIQGTIQNLMNFTGAVASGGNGLAAEIDDLERSVPEAAEKAPAPAGASANKQAAAAFAPETAGVLGLVSELLNNHSVHSRLEALIGDTEKLSANIQQVRAPLATEAGNSIRQSDQIIAQSGSETPQQLAAVQQQLSGLTTEFHQLSTAIVPLGEEAIAVGTVGSYLQEAVSTFNQASERAGRYLLVRAATLGIAILIIVVISELWRRATFRYVRDARRRRTFLVLRRVVVAVAIALALIFGVVSEFGSLATYAGFVTAGVAVALQSPILSVVAYFFLIGRYGIRVGDRVTISGVTGEVIDISLVRMYLMELAGSGPDLHSTGRIVVFSNSVIFQPSALYKQMPGIDYVWHTATLTLAPEADFQLTGKRLDAVVESVFQKYRERLERQHASLEKSADVHITPPKPESRLRFTETGLEYTVRYPAEIRKSAEMDGEILHALHEAVAEEAKLQFAQGGTPKIQV